MVQIPTSFRFKNKETAQDYDSNIEEHHIIQTIKTLGDGWFQIATTNFSWVFLNLETVQNEFEFKYNEVIPESSFND